MKLEKVAVASKQELEVVMPDISGWREEAREALEEYKTDAWREWAPEWLVPSLFVKQLPVTRGEEVDEIQEGSGIVGDHTRVEVIEEKYRKLQDEVAAAMERGDIEPEEVRRIGEGDGMGVGKSKRLCAVGKR